LADDEILQAMAAQPPQVWRKLFALIESLAADNQQVSSQEPQQDGGPIVLGFPTYSPVVLEVCGLLDDLRVVVAFDWMRWDGWQRLAAGGGLDDVSAAEAACLITAIVRGERFCDGTIALALRDGSFVAALHRIQRWYEHERGNTPPTQADEQ